MNVRITRLRALVVLMLGACLASSVLAQFPDTPAVGLVQERDSDQFARFVLAVEPCQARKSREEASMSINALHRTAVKGRRRRVRASH